MGSGTNSEPARQHASHQVVILLVVGKVGRIQIQLISHDQRDK